MDFVSQQQLNIGGRTMWKKLMVLMVLGLFVAMHVGCEKEGTAEKAGKEVDKAYDSAKDKFKEMTK